MLGLLAGSGAANADASADAARALLAAALDEAAAWIVRIDTVGGALPVESQQATPFGGPTRQAPSFRQADGPTTGVIWSADGWIVTSSFNFVRDPAVITVTLADGRRLLARLVARDRPLQLALLKIDVTEPLPTPDPLAVDALRVGQRVWTAGFGHGTARPAPGIGVLSARSRMSGVAVQTDAKTSPANYGGPLCDYYGRCIGVVVPLAAGGDELAGVEWYNAGIGFAIPADLVTDRVRRMQGGADLERGYLGISFDPRATVVGGPWPDDEPATDAAEASSQPASAPAPAAAPPARQPAGVRVQGAPAGPAAAAGLEQGDWITAIDGVATPDALAFRRALARRVAGDEIHMSVHRDATRFDVSVTLVTRAELAATAEAAQPVDADDPSEGP